MPVLLHCKQTNKSTLVLACSHIDEKMSALWISFALSLILNSYTVSVAEDDSDGVGVGVGLTLVERAAETGAFCLDGSLPAYRFDKGFDSGENNWLLYLEGGGWCNDTNSCSQRAFTHKGSSKYMDKVSLFSGILSNKLSENPDFYNWNRVKLMYCDGASFSGDVSDANQGSRLYFRGLKIWHAMIDDLLRLGMDKAEKALLAGSSAGGLATFLHCDNFHELLPSTTMVKCASDAGFFLDVKDISGKYHIRSFFKATTTLQNVVKNLPESCTSSVSDPSQCFFPQYLLPFVKTPIFVLNSAYDTWQFHNIFVPSTADPHDQWETCKLNLHSCSRNQLGILEGYRLEMLKNLQTLRKIESGGYFINSCLIHTQMDIQQTWYGPHSPMLDNKTIAQAVGDWYFDRASIYEVDCPFPCDRTCFVNHTSS